MRTPYYCKLFNFLNFEEYPYRSISIVYAGTEPTVAGTSLQPSTAFPVTTLVQPVYCIYACLLYNNYSCVVILLFFYLLLLLLVIFFIATRSLMYMIPKYSDNNIIIYYIRYIRPRFRGGQRDYRTADIAQLKYPRRCIIITNNLNVFGPFHSHTYGTRDITLIIHSFLDLHFYLYKFVCPAR